MDRLLKAVSIILGESQAGNLSHNWLMRMLMQLAAPPLDLTKDRYVILAEFIHLCAEIFTIKI